MAKLEVIAAANVGAVLLGPRWVQIETGSFSEETNGFAFTIAATEPGGARKVYVPAAALMGVME